MEWTKIKDKIYYTDNGRFRNIICYNLTLEDWGKWVDFVNTNYNVNFKSYKTQNIKNKISLDDLQNFWNGDDVDGFMATIFIENVQINCFFNVSDHLDNDIDVFEISEIRQHEIIIEYIKNVSGCIDRNVYLTKDDYEDEPRKLIEVYKKNIVYYI